MPEIAFFQFANAQARVRARLGAMPDEARWRSLADTGDIDHLIERMRTSGLAHWVGDLPRSPDTATIENHLQQQLPGLLDAVGRLLPARWSAVRRWLLLAGNFGWAQRLLAEADIEPPRRIDARLEPLFALPAEERGERLARTPYQRYLSAPAPLDRWLEDGFAACPRVSGREAYVLRRLAASLRRHRQRLLELRRQAVAAADPDPAAQWHLRDELARELRALLGGNPFHAGLILVYCLLELLQYERCRALLLARSRGWEPPPLPGSAA